MLCAHTVVIDRGLTIIDRNGTLSSIREPRRGVLVHIGFETERPTDEEVSIPP